MSRSNWKSFYIHQNLVTKNQMQFMSRNSEIVPRFIGQMYQIHNGKSFIKVSVTEEMVGHKFGEFVLTRKKFSFKKK